MFKLLKHFLRSILERVYSIMDKYERYVIHLKKTNAIRHMKRHGIRIVDVSDEDLSMNAVIARKITRGETEKSLPSQEENEYIDVRNL